MATREAIREAFYAELENAVPTSGNSGHVSASSITQSSPDDEEDLPAIVHDDNYREIPLNEASDAPTRLVTDDLGNVTNEVHAELIEARFELLFVFKDDLEKERCYEAVRTYFAKFDVSSSTWPPTNIHSAVEWVDVGDASSEDDSDVEPIRRGDRLRIQLVFQREYFHPDEGTDGDAIEAVDHLVDADDDGTTDLSFTTT